MANPLYSLFFQLDSKQVNKIVKEIVINTDFIKLSSFLKLTNSVDTGGAAKNAIVEGLVSVNKEVCTMRGKKLHNDDIVSFKGTDYVVKVR